MIARIECSPRRRDASAAARHTRAVTLARLAIATRGSALALWQAEHTRARLIATQPGLAVGWSR
jgi:hypothetical protein